MCRCDDGAQLQPRFVLTAIREQLCGADVLCTAAVDGTVVLQQLELVRAAGPMQPMLALRVMLTAILRSRVAGLRRARALLFCSRCACHRCV